MNYSVMPAQAGIQRGASAPQFLLVWIPACAGMTVENDATAIR
ncbi:MAG: hypothetical protein ACK5R4_08965 [Alphaproteobacteria bacterium]